MTGWKVAILLIFTLLSGCNTKTLEQGTVLQYASIWIYVYTKQEIGIGGDLVEIPIEGAEIVLESYDDEDDEWEERGTKSSAQTGEILFDDEFVFKVYEDGGDHIYRILVSKEGYLSSEITGITPTFENPDIVVEIEIEAA